MDVFHAFSGPTLEDMEEPGRVRRYHEDGGEAHALAIRAEKRNVWRVACRHRERRDAKSVLSPFGVVLRVGQFPWW